MRALTSALRRAAVATHTVPTAPRAFAAAAASSTEDDPIAARRHGDPAKGFTAALFSGDGA